MLTLSSKPFHSASNKTSAQICWSFVLFCKINCFLCLGRCLAACLSVLRCNSVYRAKSSSQLHYRGDWWTQLSQMVHFEFTVLLCVRTCPPLTDYHWILAVLQNLSTGKGKPIMTATGRWRKCLPSLTGVQSSRELMSCNCKHVKGGSNAAMKNH